jgi:RNA polymerase sigma-70 factor (ECF subfamily)
MARLAEGERAAFDPLFRALHPRAVRFARATLPEDQAADAAQAILLKVFSRATEFEPGKPVLPWFYAVASNELRTLRRQSTAARNRTTDETAALMVATGDDPEQQILERELRRSLDLAIAHLDAPSAEAIAALLGEDPRPIASATAFRKRVSRAYARLRWMLGGADGD